MVCAAPISTIEESIFLLILSNAHALGEIWRNCIQPKTVAAVGLAIKYKMRCAEDTFDPLRQRYWKGYLEIQNACKPSYNRHMMGHIL